MTLSAAVSSVSPAGLSASSHGERSSLSSAAFLSGYAVSSLRFTHCENKLRRQDVVSRRLWSIKASIRIRRRIGLPSIKIPRTRVPLWRGKISDPLTVPDHIERPPYVGSNKVPKMTIQRQIHNSEGISGMRAACLLAARVLEHLGPLVEPLVTTDEIDKEAHKMIIEAGAYPSSLGYGGFPKSISTSVNECMCLGIPDSRPLQDGDIVTIGVAVYLNGYHGDTSKTFICGNPNEHVRRLVRVTQECLQRGINHCKDGAIYRKIGKRISEHADKFNYGVVQRFTGHGIGTCLHSGPVIFHHLSEMHGRMAEGETFTVGPILTMGTIESTTWDDNLNTLTADGGLSAQFAHTLLVTRFGHEVLTQIDTL